MADPTDLELRRQGMADAAVALTLQRRIPIATVEEIGSWLGLRQHEIIAAIRRMKNGDELVRRLIAGRTRQRTANDIRHEIHELRIDLVVAEKAERDAARARAQEERDAARQAAAAAGQKIPATSYKNAGPCPVCGKEVRNLGVHQLSHQTTSCSTPGCDWTGPRTGLGGHRRWNHPEELTRAS